MSKEHWEVKHVLDEVSVLFAAHGDLRKQFTYFLPDRLQSQAKAQMDIAAAKARMPTNPPLLNPWTSSPLKKDGAKSDECFRNPSPSE